MNESIYKLLKSYADIGISVIPCKKTWDEKNNSFTGKMPAITGWQEYCNEIADDDKLMEFSGIKDFSGFGIATGKASNICCVDIDTTDKALIKKIEDIIPYTPCVILGADGRGGKHLFRIFDTEHEFTEPTNAKMKVKDGKKTICDILIDRSYLLAPPSLHSISNGEKKLYRWKDHDITKVGLHNLPILEKPEAIRDAIEMATRGMTKSEIALNFPVGGIDLSKIGHKEKAMEGHRHEDMVSFCNSMIARRETPDYIIRELLLRDSTRNHADPYFLDKTKGHRSEIVMINAIKFYLGNLEFANRSKKSSDLELPELFYDKLHSPASDWGEINYSYEEDALPEFDFDWIPDETMREYVKSGAETSCVAPQHIYFYLLASFSSMIGNKLKISPYRNNKSYIETFNLYVGNVAPSGGRKSETTGIALKPIRKLMKSVKENEIKENAKIEQIKKDVGIMVKKKEDERRGLVEENFNPNEAYILQLNEEIASMEAKIPKRLNSCLVEQHGTIQRMYEIAEDNPSGFFVEFNEFGTKWKEFQMKGNEAEKNFYLDGWDGRKSFTYKTKHNGENIIDELCLSVGFSAQEDIVESIVDELSSNLSSNDGMIQRFLIYCSSGIKREYRDIDFTMPNRLYELFQTAYYVDRDSEPLKLDDKAYELYREFSEWLSEKSRDEKNNAIRSAIEKYSGYVLRISGNLEVIKNKGRKPDSITSETFNTAWEIIKYTESHLRYMFKFHEKKRFCDIIELLRTSIVTDETTIRDLYRSYQREFGNNVTECKEILRKLADRNVVRLIKDGKAYRIKVNPAIFKQ